MKKNKLKSGMIIVYRNGKKRLIVGDKLIGDDAYTSLLNFSDDLKHTMHDDFDVMKVYNYKFAGNFSDLLEDDNLELIWEREEIKLTDKEIELLKALKLLGFNFLARDEGANLCAYNEKPYKRPLPNYWLSSDGWYIKVNSDACTFINWKDKEPIKIEDLLK